MSIEDHSPHLADWEPDEIDEFDLNKLINKQNIKDVSNEKLLNKILHQNDYKHYINNIVPNGRFKAYDIAEKLKNKGNRMTHKQREALENVWVHFESI